jgi:hypothetical protein
VCDAQGCGNDASLSELKDKKTSHFGGIFFDFFIYSGNDEMTPAS